MTVSMKDSSFPPGEHEQNLSMKPVGDERGYRVIMEYNDDFNHFGMEVSLEIFLEAIHHVLVRLPPNVRLDVLHKLSGRR